jgi:hypothetical protein
VVRPNKTEITIFHSYPTDIVNINADSKYSQAYFSVGCLSVVPVGLNLSAITAEWTKAYVNRLPIDTSLVKASISRKKEMRHITTQEIQAPFFGTLVKGSSS